MDLQLSRCVIVDVNRLTIFNFNKTLLCDIEVLFVLLNKRAVIRVVFMDSIYQDISLPCLCGVRGELVVVKKISGREGFGLDPAMITGNCYIGGLVF